MNELLLLDVAHGNSALLISRTETAIFDTAPKDTLLQTIAKYGITTIDYLYISHLDRDHVGGMSNILNSSSIVVKNIIINPDPTKIGPRNRRLRIIIEDAVNRHGTAVHAANVASPPVAIGEVTVQVLSPSVSDYLAGTGGRDTDGNQISSNSSSVVLKLIHDSHSIALLAADMNERTLNKLLQSNQPLGADILVFPHHGGHCATNNTAFTQSLVTAVQPQVTFFSMGRTAFRNPRADIVAAVKAAAPRTYISCTQLSVNCLKLLPRNRSDWQNYLVNNPGAGRKTVVSCGGTLHVHLAGSNTQYPSSTGLHAQFVQLKVPLALCK